MATAAIITQELISSMAPNAAAFSNGQKISKSGDFVSLSKTADETLIFGECKGSGKNPYRTSADFSGGKPILRCSCPSRQIPCKHCLAIMFEWLAKKEFTVDKIPDDIAEKREKIAKKAEKAIAAQSGGKTPSKQNKSAAAKKLMKQKEGLELAERFVTEVLERGVSSINSTSAEQYKELARQLGDYYLSEPQAIMTEIVAAAENLSSDPQDAQTRRITALCVRLASVVRKSEDYINDKLKSGSVLPEDNILYEEMGGIWKLAQLKELGLYRENVRIIQLSFNVVRDDIHKADIDVGYWLELDTGDISRTENIRPFRAQKHIKAQDSSFGVYRIKELYRYPGGLNRRIRWEDADISADNVNETDSSLYDEIMSKAAGSIAEAVKIAKNELKNTLSQPAAALLIPFDSIEFALSDGHPVLKFGSETIGLKSNADYRETCLTLSVCGEESLKNGVLLGEFFYVPAERRLYVCPLSVVNAKGIIRLV